MTGAAFGNSDRIRPCAMRLKAVRSRPRSQCDIILPGTLIPARFKWRWCLAEGYVVGVQLSMNIFDQTVGYAKANGRLMGAEPISAICLIVIADFHHQDYRFVRNRTYRKGFPKRKPKHGNFGSAGRTPSPLRLSQLFVIVLILLRNSAACAFTPSPLFPLLALRCALVVTGIHEA